MHLDHLVNRLTNEHVHDIEFTKVFLMVYRKFMRPSELLDRLMDRFDLAIAQEKDEMGAIKAGSTLSSTLEDGSSMRESMVESVEGNRLMPDAVQEAGHSESLAKPSIIDDTLSTASSTFRMDTRSLGSPRPGAKEDDILRGLRNMYKLHDDTHVVGEEELMPIHPVQLRVCNVLMIWLRHYWSDFRPMKMRITLNVFLEVISQKPHFRVLVPTLTELVCRTPCTFDPIDWGFNDSMDMDDLISLTQSSQNSRSMTWIQGDVDDDHVSVFGESRRRSVDDVCMTDTRRHSLSTLQKGKGLRYMASMDNFQKTMLGKLHSFEPSDVAVNTFFFDVDEKAIAAQLNLTDFAIFEQIKARDMLHHVWCKKHRGKHSRSISIAIDHFNRLSAWVITNIITQKKSKLRAKAALKFMRLATHLREANNYNSLMAVLAGLNSASILRLKQTMKHILGKPEYEEYLQLEALMSSEKSFALGVFLRDLVYIDETNKDFLADGSINLSKFLLMGDIILMIQSFQYRSYSITPDPRICNLILNHPVLTEEEAYQLSLKIEPKN